MTKKTVILLLSFIVIFLYLHSNPPAREFWRLNTYSSEEYSSGPGGPSGSSNSFQYIYNSERPQLIDEVNVHSYVWSNSGTEEADTTFIYNSSITLLPDSYILQQDPEPSSYLNYEIVVKDYEDRFLSYAVFEDNGELAHRLDWVYNDNGRLDEVISYRNPGYFIGVGYWKYVPHYDPADRKISETRYYSADSLSWSPAYHIHYYYATETLPESFLVKEREPYWNIGFFRFWDVMDNYQIDSLTVSRYIDSDWSRIGCLQFEYDVNLADDYISVSIEDTQADDWFLTMVYPFTYLESITFDLNGMIKSYGLYNDYDPFYPVTSAYNYTWTSESTPVSDETMPHASHNLACYPNPFSNNLNLKLLNNKSPADISIYNIKGQLIKSWKDIRTDELTWDGKDNANNIVSRGVYIIKARQGKNTYTTKVIRY